jgi:putative phage-type endonuclease
MEQRSPEWFSARRGKLTGSNVGAALGVNPWKTPDDLIRSMVRKYHGEPSDFNGNVATEYGQLHEPLAQMDYQSRTGNFVEECGFFVHPEHDWLGASPDGLIGDDGLIEIKCPFGLRNKTGADLVFKTAEEQPHYYAQMQIEMACTGRSWCDFFQWAKNRTRIERVDFDPDWFNDALPTLRAFYDRYLSELDNPAHLEEKEVEINTLGVKSLIDEYDQVCAAIDDATARKKEIMAELVKAAKERNAVMFGRKLTKVERKGSVQYGKIPELKGLDLEPYRSKPSEYWRFS